MGNGGDIDVVVDQVKIVDVEVVVEVVVEVGADIDGCDEEEEGERPQDPLLPSSHPTHLACKHL